VVSHRLREEALVVCFVESSLDLSLGQLQQDAAVEHPLHLV